MHKYKVVEELMPILLLIGLYYVCQDKNFGAEDMNAERVVL